MFRKINRFIRNWWECHINKTCTYYDHYLVYGPAELTHIGFHGAERKANAHFKNCTYAGEGLCSVCSRWEERLRA